MRKEFVLVLIFLGFLNLFGCSESVEIKADISAYSGQQIKIIGLSDEDFDITPKELAAFPCINKKVTSNSAKVGTVTATGPLLDGFLGKYGYSQSDFSRIRICAADGYKTVLKDNLLDGEIILSIAAGKEALDTIFQPLRIIIPEASSSYWTYQVTSIEFVK